MPRGSTTQTRTFNYTTLTTVGTNLLSATNPENGTVTYTYTSNNLMASKTDAKGQHFTYGRDSYNRLSSITWTNSPSGSVVLRSFMYDTNTLDGSFTSYGLGRLVAVQNAQFATNFNTGPATVQFTEMYSYTQPGQTNKKRLQVNESSTLNLDASYTYNNEGSVTSVTYPASGNTYTYSFDSMYRPSGLSDPVNGTDVWNVAYNAANQFTTIGYFGSSESRSYNSLNQLTSVSGYMEPSVTYNYTTG